MHIPYAWSIVVNTMLNARLRYDLRNHVFNFVCESEVWEKFISKIEAVFDEKINNCHGYVYQREEYSFYHAKQLSHFKFEEYVERFHKARFACEVNITVYENLFLVLIFFLIF